MGVTPVLSPWAEPQFLGKSHALWFALLRARTWGSALAWGAFEEGQYLAYAPRDDVQ